MASTMEQRGEGVEDLLAVGRKPRTQRAIFLRQFVRNKGAVTGAVLLAMVLLIAILAPLIAPHDPFNMYPQDQLRVAEAAGVDIFGPVVNTNCSKSFPWNLSRVVTFVKHVSEVSNIPIHPNVGMGVCGVPMCPVPPVDSVSRVAKTLVELGKADGL